MASRFLSLLLLLLVALLALPEGRALADDKADPLASWKPAFDPSGAKYTYLLSNVSHPAMEGIAAGYRIRDKVWERSNGQLYVDFRPLSQLGGEKDVLSKLRMGAIQGIMCSSVAAANVADKLGIVNLPYVVDTFEKLDKFRANEELFREFAESAKPAGLKVVDITGYGTYGWASTVPVRTLADAAKVNFRIAEAPVNTDLYKAWKFKFTVMPWPDVPQALQTGVINGLDHTPTVCNITKKFDIAKYFTEVNYAQGLFIHMINQRWFDKLPADLQQVLIETIEEESANSRALTKAQHEAMIADAKAKGVEFYTLSDDDKRTLIEMAEPMLDTWGKKIGQDYLNKVQAALNP